MKPEQIPEIEYDGKMYEGLSLDITTMHDLWAPILDISETEQSRDGVCSSTSGLTSGNSLAQK